MTKYILKAKTGRFKTTAGSVSFTHSGSALVWHKKYLESTKSLSKNSAWSEFLTPYLLLQVYVEVHLHNCLRILYKSQLAGASDELLVIWERQYVPIKIEQLAKLLTEENFDKNTIKKLKNIREGLRVMSDVRNQIVHGRPIVFSSPTGESEITKYLKYDEFTKQTENFQTKIIQNWNNFINDVAAENHNLIVSGIPKKSKVGKDNNYAHLYLRNIS